MARVELSLLELERILQLFDEEPSQNADDEELWRKIKAAHDREEAKTQ